MAGATTADEHRHHGDEHIYRRWSPRSCSFPEGRPKGRLNEEALPPPGSWRKPGRARTEGMPVYETHISVVIALGERCTSSKPVSLPFVDLSTPSLRRRVCERELELNRRLSADVHLGLAAGGGVPRLGHRHRARRARTPGSMLDTALAAVDARFGAGTTTDQSERPPREGRAGMTVRDLPPGIRLPDGTPPTILWFRCSRRSGLRGPVRRLPVPVGPHGQHEPATLQGVR